MVIKFQIIIDFFLINYNSVYFAYYLFCFILGQDITAQGEVLRMCSLTGSEGNNTDDGHVVVTCSYKCPCKLQTCALGIYYEPYTSQGYRETQALCQVQVTD